MEIVDFRKEHISEATELALASYCEERKIVQELSENPAFPDLSEYVNNDMGVAALENNRVVGFLCACTPFDNAFRATDVKGVFSPMEANAAISANRSKIYAAMYQMAAKKWVKARLMLHQGRIIVILGEPIVC